MAYTFEFFSTFQFTEIEIKEYIELNNIKKIEDIKVDDIIEYTKEKYQIGGWYSDLYEDSSENDREDFFTVCEEILKEKS